MNRSFQTTDIYIYKGQKVLFANFSSVSTKLMPLKKVCFITQRKLRIFFKIKFHLKKTESLKRLVFIQYWSKMLRSRVAGVLVRWDFFSGRRRYC